MTSPMASGDAASSALTVVPTDLLICVFVHGYAFYRMCGRRPTVRGRFKGGPGAALSISFFSQRLPDSGCPLGDSTNQGHPRSTTMATYHWTYFLRYSREWRRYPENRTNDNLTSVPRFASEYVQK